MTTGTVGCPFESTSEIENDEHDGRGAQRRHSTRSSPGTSLRIATKSRAGVSQCDENPRHCQAFLVCWHGDGELGSAVGSVGGVDRAVVGGDQFGDDGEADAAALGSPG